MIPDLLKAVLSQTGLAAILAAASLFSCALPPTPREGSLGELEQALPLDPKVTRGELENGIRYYIRVNRKPEKRAELRLVINAGSVLEDDDQQGLAHLTEHMAFNGTTHFKKQELVDYLESIGMRSGADLNAYTSFDETVYQLKIPTDQPGIMLQAFQILEDWAQGVSFEDQEIEQERGVVIEEWRLGRGAEARMRDKQFPILFKNSNYARRLPIGQKAVLDTFHHTALRRFYRDWYRPDLMAVVAVGDFNPARVEGLIRLHFGFLPDHPAPRERVLYPVPDQTETLVAIASDPEATGSQVSVYYKQEVDDAATHGAYRRLMVRSLYNGMLNRRLEELTRKPEAPFLYGFSTQGRFVRTKEVYMLTAGVQDNGIEKGLQALLVEAERVARYGFTPGELERMGKELLRWVEQARDEKDKTPSRRYAAEYIRNYLQDEPIPGIDYEYQLYQQYLPGIGLGEINRLAREWLTNPSRVVLVNIPEKEGLAVPDEDSLRAIFKAVAGLEIAPYQDAVSTQPLVVPLPPPGRVARADTIPALGLYRWELDNGVRVLLKPTDFKNDEILFTAYSPGGTSLIDEADYLSGRLAASIVAESGLGAFDQTALRKRLAGIMVQAAPYLGEIREGLSGSTSPKDMETLFQLIHLYFTAPRKDEQAFLAFRERVAGFLSNRSADPAAAFRDTIQVTMAQYHPRARPLTVEQLDEVDLETAHTFYRQRFADASDFTFILVGNFDLQSITSLVQTYLGSLPDHAREESWRDVGIELPSGVISKRVFKGLEPKSLTQLIFTGPFQWNRRNRYELASLAQVLRLKLREVLREELGGTYGVSVSARPFHYPRERYRLTISFGSQPNRVEELTAEVLVQIDSLKTQGTTPVYLSKVQETQRRERETNLKENGFWLNILDSYDFHGERLTDILEYESLVAGLTLETIQSAAKQYCDTSNYVQVTLYPEGLE